MNIIKSIFSKIFKGEQGEADVFEAIGKILNSKGDENYGSILGNRQTGH